MQRQRHAVGLGQRVDRRPARGIQPVLRDALLTGQRDDRGVVRVEQQVELRLVEVLLVAADAAAVTASASYRKSPR